MREHVIALFAELDRHAGNGIIHALADAHRSGAERVTLVLDSVGGNAVACAKVVNFLKTLPIQIDTWAHGTCGSSAATLFLAGTRRYASPNALLAFHPASVVIPRQQAQWNLAQLEPLLASLRSVDGWQEEVVRRIVPNLDPAELFVADSQVRPLEWFVQAGIVNEVKELRIPAGVELATIWAGEGPPPTLPTADAVVAA